MKAAVIFQKDELPQYVDFPEPVAKGDNELLVLVKAVALKHFDKSRASGKHYSTVVDLQNERVPGGDGVCVLPDGRRIFAMGVSGMLAEKGKFLGTGWGFSWEHHCYAQFIGSGRFVAESHIKRVSWRSAAAILRPVYIFML